MEGGNYEKLCWGCGSPTHKVHECRASVQLELSKPIRNFTQTEFYQRNPQKKRQEDTLRGLKYHEKGIWKSEAHRISWNLIGTELIRLLDLLCNISEKISDQGLTHYSINDDENKQIFERVSSWKNQLQDELPNIRNVIACGSAKLNAEGFQHGQNDIQLDIYWGRIEDLKGIRDRLWLMISGDFAEAKSVCMAMEEFNRRGSSIAQWSKNFRDYASLKPEEADFGKIDEDIITQKVEIQNLESNAVLLNRVTNLRASIDAKVVEARKALNEAISTRKSMEHGSFLCGFCKLHYMQMCFPCGHGCCQTCRPKLTSCYQCGYENLWCIPLKM